MTTKTYDSDPLGILEGTPKNDPLGILNESVKKKESSPVSSGPSLSASASVGAVIESTPPSTSQSPLDIKGIFEFNKGKKKAPLPAQSGDVDINNIANGVYMGNIEADELSNAYNNVFSKPIIENVIKQYAPDLGGHGWDKEVFRNEEKWDELSKRIKTKNRINAKVGKDGYMKEVDQEIYNAVTNFKSSNLLRDESGTVVTTLDTPLPVIDINNPSEYSKVIEQLKSSDKVIDKDGNEVVGAKQRLISALNEKAKSITAEQGVDPEVSSMDDKVASAIARSNINREIGENISTDEFAKNDKQNAEHFKLGLSYLKKVQPGQYKNVVRVIDEGKQVPDDDFRNIAEVGQEILNDQVFFKAAENPELIDKETFLDYATRSDKKSQYAAVIGERLKAAGGKNRREFSEAEIKKAAFDLPNKSVVQELANEEKIFGYDAIPKSGAIEAIVQGINQPFDGIKSTFELFSESPAETYIRSKKLDTGSGQKVADAEGNISGVLPSDRGNIYYDALRGLGQFIPQVLLTKGIGGGVAGVVGADARLALTPALRSGISTYSGTSISTYLQSYGDSYADYLQKTADPATARLGATVDAAAATAFETFILPDVKIADKALAGLRGNLSNDIIDLVKKGGDPATLAKNARPFVQKFVTNSINIVGQEVSEEVGTQLVDYITESILSPQTSKDRDLGKELLETAKATAISMAIPALLGGAGSSVNQDFTKSAFTSAAINFDDYRQALDKQLNNDAISQPEYNAAIKLLSTHKESINAAPNQNINGVAIDGQKQLDYAYEDTKIKVYKEKAAASDGVAKEMWESKIKQSEDIQREIVMPKVTEPVASVTEDVIVDETVNTLSPQETITKAVTDEVITGVEADLIKQGTATPDDVLLSLAKQKYGVADDGSVFPEGGRDISMKTSLDVDEAVEKTFPTQQSVIDAIKKPTEPVTQNQPSSVSVVQPEQNVAPNVVTLVKPKEPVVDLGTRVQTSEPPATEGVTPVTLSGLTEQERQSKIERRVKETTVTDTQKQINDLLKKVKSYNSLPKGRLGKLRPSGLQQLNNIRLEAQKLGLTFDERAGQLKTSGNRNVRTDNREIGDMAIAPNAIVLRDRSQQTQDVFNQLNEAGQFPNGYRLDNKQMSAAEIDGAIQDIVDGVPSERANNYLNQIEKYIAADRFEIGNPGEIKLAPSLNDLLGVKSETQTQPMTQDALEAWLNEQGELTPEQEQIVIDNIENLIQDYEPAVTTETVVQPTQPTTEATSSPAVEQDKKPVNTPTPTAKTTEATPTKPTVKSLTDELRSLLGNEAVALDTNPKSRKSFKEVGITKEDSRDEWIDKMIAYGGEFTNIFKAAKADPNFKNIQLELVDSASGLENGESALYYPVGYGEGKDMLLQLSNKDNVIYTSAHELMHFLTLDSDTANQIKDTQSYKAVTDFYNYIADKKGKPVAIAGGATIESYGLTNEKEFMAELLINPAFRNYVSDVFAENKDDIFKASKSIRDSKVNSIGDIIYNFFKDIYNKLFSSPSIDIPFDEKQSVVDNAAKLATQLFFGGENVIVGQTDSGEGATVLGMGSTDLRTAALALPGTDRNAQINTFVKSALDRGVNEADLKQALINNGISEDDAQGYIDSNKTAPDPSPPSKPSTRSDNEIISTVLTQRLDAKTFPTLFSGNEEQQQIAANTQGVAQNREVDGAYIVATEKDLKEISVQSAKLLRDELGKDWGVKTLAWIEKNPSQGNIAQVVGVLNVISTENFQDIQDTHDGNRVNKLSAIQKRIDVVSIQRARDAALGLVQRRLYAQFAQGGSVSDVVANSILSKELQDLQADLNEIVSSQPTDNELNSVPPLKPTTKKRTTIRNVTGTAKRRSNPAIKDELISKGAETAGKTKKTFKELIEDAKNKLKNTKC